MKKIVGVFLCVVLASCVTQQSEPDEKIRVVVTILPQAEFVEKVGGDTVQVVVMVPPGASPHTYEPTPGQLTDVSKARMYVKVGSGIEFELAWMDRIVEMNKDMVVIDCSQGIEFIRMEYGHEDENADENKSKDEKDEEKENEHEKEHEKGYDPHIWLSPKNAVMMVETIYNGLIHIAPANKDYYTKNKKAYIKELKTLDKDITQALSNLNPRKIMVYHPSWAYFCRDYGLEQIPIEKEGKEPTPQRITQVITQAKHDRITIIFASPQVSTQSAEVIAQEIGGKVVLLDPLAKEYSRNMRKVAEAFAEVLYGCC